MADKTGPDGLSRRRFIAAAGAAGTVGIAGCTGEDNPDNSFGPGGSGGAEGEGLVGNISLAGSSTVFPIASAVAEEFQRKHAGVDITVQSTGSGGGFANFFCKGRTDFNNASRSIAEEEKRNCSENGVEWHKINVATDALTVIVNNETDFVDHLTVEELRSIWKPDPVETWSEVRDGFPDETIERYGAAETSGTFDYFTEAVVGEEGAHTQAYQATEDDNQIVTGVSGSQYAIGYFGFAFYQGNTDRVKALGIDNGDGPVKPSLETAQSGEYAPLSRPLFTYAAQDSMTKKHIAEFARFYVRQSANRELIAESIGYVPNTDEQMREQLDQLNQFIQQA
ncbi:PstS family phosphate ABC transporter substrate-binding protein [Halorarum halophilum]|uniref:PstS family phosphate ABC transporter substrate-binding protein n=1 Tax=Halorarum halophilum TaxID=2743090 RepID=A0A7D5GKZ6_9EURY|nr:PstS family phosphate ABC transporter substrate-binding protein [Halobaculum halophilum]QLG27687.1 PstS family phosphate ABC transporter substrate-binding protein [Halobaculum halophilum]